MPLAMRPCSLYILSSFVLTSPRRRGLSIAIVRARAAAVKFGHEAAATPSRLPGLAKRTLRPRALRFGWGFLYSVPDAARVTLQLGVGLPRRSGAAPADLGTVE